MSTMLEDYRNMDVRGASVKNGLRQLYFDASEVKMLAKLPSLLGGPVLGLPNIMDMLVGAPFSWLAESGAITMWRIGRRVKDYNCRWSGVPSDEKRDVIAALRAATKTAKYAALATKLLVWLA